MEREDESVDGMLRCEGENGLVKHWYTFGKREVAVNERPTVLRVFVVGSVCALTGFFLGVKSSVRGDFGLIVVTVCLTLLIVMTLVIMVYMLLTKARHMFPSLDGWLCGFTVNLELDAGNANKNVYKYIPDNKLTLTRRGYEQALAAGLALKELVKDESIIFFVSPYIRTRQTLKGIIVSGNLDPRKFSVREDPRLREQEFGNLQDPGLSEQVAADRDAVGRFWYRVPGGESGADVFDRVTSFLQTLYREIDSMRPTNEVLENVVIVSHGLAIRLFCMRYLHWTTEEFEQVWNPHNCEMWVMEKNGTGRYELVTPIQIGKNKDQLMPLSMRVPHRQLGQDLEAYLASVKDHCFTSPLLDGIEIDPTSLAAGDTSDLSSMRTLRSKAESDMDELRQSLQQAEYEDVDELSDEEKEDSVFIGKKHSSIRVGFAKDEYIGCDEDDTTSGENSGPSDDEDEIIGDDKN